MSISVVIPTVSGNEEILKRCIDSLKLNTNIPFEVIVEKNTFKGTTEPMNRGIRKAGLNDVVIISDDTVILEPMWLEKMIKKLNSNPKCLAVSSSTTLNKKHKIYDFEYHLGGFNPIYIKREAFNRIGLLDENLMCYGEEKDFCIRLTLAGFTILYEPLRNDHIMETTIAKFLNTEAMKNISEEYLNKKWRFLDESLSNRS